MHTLSETRVNVHHPAMPESGNTLGGRIADRQRDVGD